MSEKIGLLFCRCCVVLYVNHPPQHNTIKLNIMLGERLYMYFKNNRLNLYKL